jgi:SAM-dependent methyltransferase
MNRNEWNARYASPGLFWMAEPNVFLVEQVADLSPGRALDLGAGEGRNAIWLAEQGWRVTAVDFAEAGLAKARELAEQRGVSLDLVHADLTEYHPEAGAFDLVALLYLHLPRPDLTGVVERARRSVAPGGTFLLIGHERSNLEHGYSGPQRAELLYTADEIAGMLGDLQIEVAETRRRTVETEEGVRHPIDCLVRARAPR